MLTKAEKLSACAKAIREILTSGKTGTPAQIRIIRDARLVLLGFIRDLANPKKRVDPSILRAMKDLHPRTPYCSAMLIRDIADVCVTLNRMEENGSRTDTQKIADSAIMCSFLHDELKESYLDAEQ